MSGTKIEFGNPTNTNGENLTKVRRWDSNEIEIKSQEWIDLEGGIKVKFSSKLPYETGDYWLIPARTATNDIEWPNDNGEPAKPIPQLPRGIRHDYARLGLVKINQDGDFEGPKEGEILDKRIIFPSLQNSFDKVNGGDITGKVTIKAELEVTENVTITDTLDVNKSTNLATQKGNVAIGSDSHQAELGVTGNVTITDTLDVNKSANLAINEGNVAIGSKANEAELGVTGNVTITDTLDVNKSANLAINEGNVAIGIQQSDTQAKLHTKSSGWFPEDSTQWPKITEIVNPEKTQIKVNDATGLDKGVLLKIEGVSELRRVTDIDGTTLTIQPGLKESIENESEQLLFQYQQPIARFDSQLNGQVENQLTVVGDGTVLAKDIKAKTLEVGEVFSIVLPTGETDPSQWTRQEIQTILNSLKTIKISDNNAGFNLEGISEVLTYSDGKAIKILDVVAIITEAIKQNRQVIVELNNKIERQKTRINTAEIANLTTRINALEDQNLETEITSLRTRIDILDALEEGDLETEIDELKTEIAILEEENLDQKITELKTRIEELDPLEEENLETEITDLKTEIDSLEQQKVEIAGLKKRIEALERQNLQATIAKLTKRIKALEPQNPEETLEEENPGGT